MRHIKSFTIDPEIDEYVSATKGDRSASERVNTLLRRAILLEQLEKVESEAAAFYSTPHGRAETKAFQKASLRTWSRDA